MNKNNTYNENLSFKYLIDYGISNKIGDLYYKQLENGTYVVLWKSCRDIDVFLCKCLPQSHEEIDSTNIIKKILSFDCNDIEKVERFKNSIMSLRK